MGWNNRKSKKCKTVNYKHKKPAITTITGFYESGRVAPLISWTPYLQMQFTAFCKVRRL